MARAGKESDSNRSIPLSAPLRTPASSHSSLCYCVHTYRRSTSEAGKKAIAAALAGGGTPAATEASVKCLKERNWRFGYHKHFEKLVRLGCTSPRVSASSAAAGLQWMYDNMVFHSIDQAQKGPFGATVDKVKASFHTATVKGTKSAKDLVYKIPFDGGWHPTRPHPPAAGKALSGDSLKKQAFKWAEQGMIEPDAADALCWTSDYFSAGKTLNGVYVVMIVWQYPRPSTTLF